MLPNALPSCRFMDKMHEEFVCSVCLEVALEPVAVNDCEHIFCRQCIDAEEITRCPTCQEPLKDPKWYKLRGAIKRCYFGLVLKCLNPDCDQKLDVKTFVKHDNYCDITFDFCDDWNYESRRSESNEHSCGKVLKEFYESKLNEVKFELDQLKEQFKEERKRSEDLMILCTTFRQSFQGSSGYEVTNSNFQNYVTRVVNRDPDYDFNRAIKLIVEEYEKHGRNWILKKVWNERIWLFFHLLDTFLDDFWLFHRFLKRFALTSFEQKCKLRKTNCGTKNYNEVTSQKNWSSGLITAYCHDNWIVAQQGVKEIGMEANV